LEDEKGNRRYLRKKRSEGKKTSSISLSIIDGRMEIYGSF